MGLVSRIALAVTQADLATRPHLLLLSLAGWMDRPYGHFREKESIANCSV